MSARTVLFLFSLPIVALLAASCGNCSKKIDCPGYNDTLLDQLFPYTDNQQLLFKTTTNERQFFSLRNTETTRPYQASGGAFDRAPVCDARKVFSASERDSSGRSQFVLTLSSAEQQHSADLWLAGTQITFLAFADTGFNTIAINNVFVAPVRQPSAIVGNRTFTDVITATRDTTAGKTAGVYKIYYTKAEGIVGYAEYPSLKTWVKQ